MNRIAAGKSIGAAGTIAEYLAGAQAAPGGSSLRAQRSNPESLRGKILDCFVARAPRNDGARGNGVVLQSASALQTRLPVLAAGFARALLDLSTLK
ncbi:hypothetical protein CWO91_22090, partial [Bradyrhizobium genosp. SA-3]